ncbi:MAG: glycosyltransferase family 1 protein [Rhizobiales bacterium TMED94]|nr:MAG: glycosyltransferase family 1 protein [Rhizobiales bacterium TMED94]
MKKVLVINNKYKIKGGEDSNIIDEINLLKNKYTVEFLEFDNSKKMTLTDLISLFTNSNLDSNQKLIKKLKSFNPDAVYVHNLWFVGNLGILKILKKYNFNTLIKIHNFRYHCARSFLIKKHLNLKPKCNACNMSSNSSLLFNKYFHDSYLRSFLLIIFIKRYLNILKSNKVKILTITNFHQHYLIKSGVNEKKLNLYLNPIEIKKTKYNKNLSDSNSVIYAGRLNNEKGIKELLRTWEDVEKNNLILHIYGTGPLEEELVKKYSSENIIFYGEVNNNIVIDAISKARAVITSTKMYEGQPRLLCEASSFGVPSIFPSYGGMTEFFPNDYKFSFKQFDYNDLLKKIRLLEDTEILNQEGIRVQEYLFDKLDKNNLLDKFDKILEKN